MGLKLFYKLKSVQLNTIICTNLAVKIEESQNYHFLDWTKFKAFADNKCCRNNDSCFLTGKKTL